MAGRHSISTAGAGATGGSPSDAAVVLRGPEWADVGSVVFAPHRARPDTEVLVADTHKDAATPAGDYLPGVAPGDWTALPIGLWRADAGGTLLDVSVGFLRLLGLTPGDEPPRTLGDCFADPAEADRLLDRLRADGRVENFGAALARYDGRAVWASFDAAVSDAGGEWHVEGSAADRTAEHDARHAARPWEDLAESAFAGLVEVAVSGQRVLRANGHFAALAGRPAGELAGTSLLDCWHPSDRRSVEKEWAARVEGGPDAWEAERRLVHRGGGVSWVHVAGRLVRGGAPRAVLVVHDVTARRRAEARQREARQVAEAAAAAKDDFLAQLSHELRVPLAPALTAATLLAGDGRLPDDARRDMEMVARNVAKQARLLDDLLDLGRATSGKLRLRQQRFDLAGVLNEAVQIARPDADAKGVELTFACDDACVGVIDGDRTRVEQVAWNLLKNAVKFTPAGGAVRLACRAHGPGRVTFEVADTGVGIAPADLRRIFEPFAQADGNDETTTHGRAAGLGLGLAVARTIVRLHGGTLAAHSAGVGRGSVFTVTLPAVEGEAAEAARASTPVAGARVLLVDDHTDTARLMARLLRRQGYETTTAATLGEAREMAAGRPDAVVCDLDLPDGTGHDLAHELAAGAGRPALLAVSGHGAAEDVRAALAAGFDAHLTKPVAPEVLLEQLARLLRRRLAAT